MAELDSFISRARASGQLRLQTQTAFPTGVSVIVFVLGAVEEATHQCQREGGRLSSRSKLEAAYTILPEILEACQLHSPPLISEETTTEVRRLSAEMEAFGALVAGLLLVTSDEHGLQKGRVLTEAVAASCWQAFCYSKGK